MDAKNSIPSDVIGTLPPLCPSDLDARIHAAEKKDSILEAILNAVYQDQTIADFSNQDAPTQVQQQMYQPDDSDVTPSSLMDTIHYLSPVSPLSPRSVYEGDIDYRKLIPKGIPSYPSEPSTISSSTISCVEPQLQRTIAIVKPEAMLYQDVVVRAVTKAGFSFIDTRVVHFTPEEVSEIFCQYYGSPAFPHQVVSMSIGPVLVLSLADICAVSKWRDLIGPEKLLREEWFYPMSMRVRFGLMDSMPNAVHASENLTDANRENRYVFPRNILEPIIEELDKVTDFCNFYVNSTLLEGLIQLVKAKPIEPILFLAEWLLLHNPYQPHYSKDIGLLPT